MLRNGRWTPTFPNAKYIFHKDEYASWEAIAARGEAPPGMLKGNLSGNSWSYNCRPIVEAGQALLVDDTFQLDDNFTLVPTPGHSPCHCCVMIRSQGQEAIVTGDMMHHALQCREPDWSTIFDTDPVQAAQSRRRPWGAGRQAQRMSAAVHFPEPHRRPGRGGWRPLPLYVRAVAASFSLGEKVVRVARGMRAPSYTRARRANPHPYPLSPKGVGRTPVSRRAMEGGRVKNIRPWCRARSPRRAQAGRRQSTP